MKTHDSESLTPGSMLESALLVVASAFICLVVETLARRLLNARAETSTLMTLLLMEAQSGAMLWSSILSHFEPLHVVMYYAYIPRSASVLVDVSQYPAFEWWVILQGVKVLLAARRGVTESLLRHIHLVPIYMFAKLHDGSISTPLLAHLIMFHFVDGVRDTVDFIYTAPRSTPRTRARDDGRWTSKLIVLGVWFNWKVWMYSQLARESFMDLMVLAVPVAAQLALGIKMLVYLK